MHDNFTASLLIAMPTLKDPHFHKSVCLICSHTDEGAMGIVINKPTTMTVKELMNQLSITCANSELASKSILNGGPVGTEQGFIIHDGAHHWKSTLQIQESLCLTTSSDILEYNNQEMAQEHILIALGYAGWAPGQLENEIAQNSWLLVPASTELLFCTQHDDQWLAAGRQIGVDLNLMSSSAGHS